MDIWIAAEINWMRWKITIEDDRNGAIKESEYHNQCHLHKQAATRRLLNEQEE